MTGMKQPWPALTGVPVGTFFTRQQASMRKATDGTYITCHQVMHQVLRWAVVVHCGCSERPPCQGGPGSAPLFFLNKFSSSCSALVSLRVFWRSLSMPFSSLRR